MTKHPARISYDTVMLEHQSGTTIRAMLCTWPHCDWAQKIMPCFWEGHNIHFQASQVWVDYTMASEHGPPSSAFKKSYQFKKMQLHIKTHEREDCNKLSGTQNFPIPTYRPGAFFGQPRERFGDAHIPTPGDVAPKKQKKKHKKK
jgi:hypothetical protein